MFNNSDLIDKIIDAILYEFPAYIDELPLENAISPDVIVQRVLDNLSKECNISENRGYITGFVYSTIATIGSSGLLDRQSIPVAQLRALSRHAFNLIRVRLHMLKHGIPLITPNEEEVEELLERDHSRLSEYLESTPIIDVVHKSVAVIRGWCTKLNQEVYLFVRRTERKGNASWVLPGGPLGRDDLVDDSTESRKIDLYRNPTKQVTDRALISQLKSKVHVQGNEYNHIAMTDVIKKPIEVSSFSHYNLVHTQRFHHPYWVIPKNPLTFNVRRHDEVHWIPMSDIDIGAHANGDTIINKVLIAIRDLIGTTDDGEMNYKLNDPIPEIPIEQVSYSKEALHSKGDKSPAIPPEVKDYIVFENSSTGRPCSEEEIKSYRSEDYEKGCNIFVDYELGDVVFRGTEGIQKNPFARGPSHNFLILILILLKMGSSWDTKELGSELYSLKAELTKKPTWKDTPEKTRKSGVAQAIKRIKDCMKEALGNDLVESFIDSKSEQTIYLRPCDQIPLRTCLILHKSSYRMFRQALGRSGYNSPDSSGE